MTLLERTDHQTYCPYKGDCSYYSIPLGGERSVNAVWTYEAPLCSSRRDQGSRRFLSRPRRRDRGAARGRNALILYSAASDGCGTNLPRAVPSTRSILSEPTSGLEEGIPFVALSKYSAGSCCAARYAV